jgi:cell division protein FtsQ
MLKNINWKGIFKGFSWAISLLGLVLLLGFVEGKKQSVKCTNVKILIPGADNFIEREEIDAMLKQNEGQLIGRKLEGINLNEIENRIKVNPYIAYAKVYSDMDGVIHIEIKQRQPLLRIINQANQDFYVDRNGLKIPVSGNFTADVVVANGSIMESYSGRLDTLSSQLAKDLYKTAMFIKDDTLWDAQIEQIFVDDKKDIELIPRVGNQRIILGNADSIEVKMNNLLAFYKEAMPKVGWDAYKTISIKYTNQIVCERSKADSVVNTPKPAPTLIRDSAVKGKIVMDSIIKDEIIKEIKKDPIVKKVVQKATPPVVKSKVNTKANAKVGSKVSTQAKPKVITQAKPKVSTTVKTKVSTIVKPKVNAEVKAKAITPKIKEKNSTN